MTKSMMSELANAARQARAFEPVVIEINLCDGLIESPDHYGCSQSTAALNDLAAFYASVKTAGGPERPRSYRSPVYCREPNQDLRMGAAKWMDGE
jgi:hypothetical protein